MTDSTECKQYKRPFGKGHDSDCREWGDNK